jgi:uncharacterized protein (TIGR00369 family)
MTDGFDRSATEAIFHAPFIDDLGIRLLDIGPSWCETELQVQPRHQQQHGFIHGGVIATLADHTAGGAATTKIAAGQLILTAEFKINLLRPAGGERLHCRAEVLKPGKALSVVESEVFDFGTGSRRLVAKFLATMAVVSS